PGEGAMADASTERLESLVIELTELTERLGRLEGRVAQLEGRPSAERTAAAPPPRTAGPEPPAAGLPPGLLALSGRTLLVLAGAYLVRALTDGQVLPAAAGVFLGLAYAAVFQLLADREALAGRHASAVFHDVASSAIAFP